MQIFQKLDINHSSETNSSETKPIDTHLGRQIFATRVASHSNDKGIWLQWCHPNDVGRRGVIKYGHFVAPNQPIEDGLHAVYQMIEANLELELYYDQEAVSNQPHWQSWLRAS